MYICEERWATVSPYFELRELALTASVSANKTTSAGLAWFLLLYFTGSEFLVQNLPVFNRVFMLAVFCSGVVSRVSEFVSGCGVDMSNETRFEQSNRGAAVPISFVDRLQGCQHFDTLFKDGMALVERTACYLDTQGRRDAKGLTPELTVLYATESMRLTTRLLDVASWLLIRRALKQGEINETQARLKGYTGLPPSMRQQIDESFLLLDRIVHLDRALSPELAPPGLKPAPNEVGAQLLRLERAFGNG